MGASSSDRKIEILFSAYKSFENNINHMKEFKNFSKDVYLVSTKTIPNFISIIKKYYGNEKKLKKKFADYEFEKNIKVYSSYKECINVINNKVENEFIIVDSEFILKMDIRNSYPVNLEYDGGNIEIIFPVCQFLLNMRQKDNELGIYEFFMDKDEFNPTTIVKMQNNENKKKTFQSCSHLNNNNNFNNDFNFNNNNYKNNNNNNYNNFNNNNNYYNNYNNNFNNNDLNNNPNNNINFNGNNVFKSSMFPYSNNPNYYANN